MTRKEWAQLSYLAFAEWWDAPQTEEHERVWFAELERFERDAVHEALRGLLRDSPRFAPRLGEVIARLEPALPSFDEAWVLIEPVLRNATQMSEAEAVAAISERAGPVVAGWVAAYGARRLALEPVFDPAFGGAVLKRLGEAYRQEAETAEGRQRAVQRAQRAVNELGRAQAAQLVETTGVGLPD